VSTSFDLTRPARVTVGAIGPPGKRVFYLQAREGARLVSLKLEKQHVLFLAGGLAEVLADLAAPERVPDEAELQLEEPVEPAWAVGSLRLAYDPKRDRVLLVAREAATGPEEAEGQEDEEAAIFSPEELTGEAEGAAVARVALTREQAAGVIEHGKRLLQGGRPPCPFCGYPLDLDHSCPKANGHHAPSL
jgi:uncharacterized repeat protein (TIGR03847 family)